MGRHPTPIPGGAHNIIGMMTDKAAAAELGVGFNTVRRWRRRLGIRAFGDKHDAPRVRLKNRALAKEVMREQSAAVVAKKHGITRQAVHVRVRPFIRTAWVWMD